MKTCLGFQELGDKEPNGVPVGSVGKRGRGFALVPAELGAEPLEHLQLFRRQPGSLHAFCSDMGLLRKTQNVMV